MSFLIALCLALLSASAYAGECNDRSQSSASHENCGAYLLGHGWNEVARCDDGHSWSYILKKNDEQKYCKGINALAGPEEDLCVTYTGDIDAFKSYAGKEKVDCWGIVGMKKNIEKDPR